MSCAEMRELVLERQAGRLAPELERALEAHLAACPGCARADRAERALTDLLEAHLPRASAPPALVHRIAQLGPRPVVRPLRRDGWRRWAWSGAAAAAAACLAAVLTFTAVRGGGGRPAGLDREAVNDHLRVLLAQRPLEIESGGLHQVKPWFEGKLDFAPVVPDLRALGLELRGGAVGYFHDRRAAVLQYQLRAHLVTLMAFRPDGLELPDAPRASRDDRGFHAVLWRSGPLGYALVADVEPAELERVAAAVAEQVERARSP